MSRTETATEFHWEELAEFVRIRLLLDPGADIQATTRLISSGLLDSYSVVELLTHIETQYRLRFPPAWRTLEHLDTLEDIVRALREIPRPYNAAVDLLERNLAPTRRGRPYLLTAERAISFDEAIATADALATGLLDAGLERGDRVLLLTQDCAEFVCTFWGAMKAGLVPVPLAPATSPADLRFVLEDSGARALVFDASVERIAQDVSLSGVLAIAVHASRLDGTRLWRDLCRGGSKLEPALTSEADTSFWLYTSGTTGKPKAVLHTHRSLRVAPAGLSSQILALGGEDVVLSASRMFFAYGLGNSVYLPAAAGAAVVVDRFPVTPGSIQGLIERHRPTILFGVPAFYAGYAGLPEADPRRSIRLALSAGETLPPDVFTRFHARFGLTLLDGLGCTEMMHHVTSNRPDDALPGCAGRPLDGFDVQVRDDEGAALPEGESGQLWLRGPTAFAGYWRHLELTQRALVDGWFRTGDRASIRDGRVYHEGRFDDLMKLGGIWVAPTEIEQVLTQHPDVDEAGVVVIHNTDGIPALRAFIRSSRTDPALDQELAQACRAQLAAFKVPRWFERVAKLPRTATGKLRRFELREPASPAADPPADDECS